MMCSVLPQPEQYLRFFSDLMLRPGKPGLSGLSRHLEQAHAKRPFLPTMTLLGPFRFFLVMAIIPS